MKKPSSGRATRRSMILRRAPLIPVTSTQLLRKYGMLVDSGTSQKLIWKKIDAVTYGGKGHFWKNQKHALWVVWDRLKQKWSLEGVHDNHGYYSSPQAAKQAAERQFNKQERKTTK